MEMELIGERIRTSISHALFQSGTSELSVTVSVGGIWIGPGASPSVDVVLNRADELLYEAKRTGRNRVVAAGWDDPSDFLAETAHSGSGI